MHLDDPRNIRAPYGCTQMSLIRSARPCEVIQAPYGSPISLLHRPKMLVLEIEGRPGFATPPDTPHPEAKTVELQSCPRREILHTQP